MKIHSVCSILFTAILPLHSLEQTIPFSFYQIPGHEQSAQDIFSAATNPAMLGSLKKTTAAMYSEMRYALRDLTHNGGSIGIPVSSGSFGMHVLHVGDANFSETAFLLQHARKLSVQKSHVGISFGMLQKKDKGYHNIQTYQAAIGLRMPLFENIGYNVVMCVKQMHQTDVYRSTELGYQLGLGCRFTTQFDGAVQISKDAKRDVRFYVKGDYQLHSRASIAVICATATQELWTQAVFRLKNMQLGFSVAFHQIMGATPGCMIMTKE